MIRTSLSFGRRRLPSNGNLSFLADKIVLSDERSDRSIDSVTFRQRGGSCAFPSFKKRTFSTESKTTLREEGASITASSVDSTIDKIFKDQEVTNVATDTVAATTWDPTWYNVADQAVEVINLVRDFGGVGYGAAIVGTTLSIRILLFPLFVKLQRNTARMAHMQPEMQVLRAKIDSLGSNVSQEQQIKYGLQMKALFKKYEVNPLSSLLPPLVQLPIFMGMFFGIRKMPTYDCFSGGLSGEGLFWFHDLTTYDPLFILPLISSCTMLASIEVGKDQMMASNPKQGKIMLNVFRGMSVIMFPVVYKFSAALNLYWVCNNSVTALQAALFKNKAARKALGIWEIPKAVPGMPQATNIMDSIKDAVKRKPSEAQLIKEHNESIEIQNRAEALTQPQGRKRGRGRTRFRSRNK